MRFTAVLLVALVGLWFYFDAPVPMQAAKPMEPSEEIPTFASAVASLDDRRLVREAFEMGRVQENPERRELREAFHDAHTRLMAYPCDDEAQRDFGLAAAPFIESAQGKRQLPLETVTIDGKQMNVSVVIEEEIYQSANLALFTGQIKPENLPPSLAGMVRVMNRARSPKGLFTSCVS